MEKETLWCNSEKDLASQWMGSFLCIYTFVHLYLSIQNRAHVLSIQEEKEEALQIIGSYVAGAQH